MAYFDKYGVEFSDDMKTLIKCPEDFKGEYIIPDGVISIEFQAFGCCKNLTSIAIPNSVTNIGAYAFFCSALIGIEIPDNVVSIGEYAFADCRFLSLISFRGKVKRIGDLAFYNCSQISKVILPDSVILMGASAFCDCKNLNFISLSSHLSKIESYTFAGCSSLKSIFIHHNITCIEVGAFDFCSSLKEIIVPKGQKERFEQMEGLKDVKDKIVELSSENQKSRTWEEVNAEYRAYFEKRQKENPNIQNKNGGTPLEFPPFGIELSIQEYSQFKKEGRTIHSWMFWCKSGNEIHELARLYAPVNSIGLSTPRQGYYKVVGIEGEGNETMLVCYYNLFSSDEFLEEEDEKVRVKQKPLFNKHSSCAGPIDVGDIIHVKSTELVEDNYNGRTYQAYKIIWEYV